MATRKPRQVVTSNEIGAALLSERLSRGLSQVEAAQLMGASQTTYSGWELGRYLPGDKDPRMIASFLRRDGREWTVDEVLDVLASDRSRNPANKRNKTPATPL